MIKKLLFITLFFSFTQLFSQEDKTQFIIETPYGNMKGELYNETPQHRDNFIKLVKEGWYKDSPFHRVINHFMIQGGQNADGRRDPGYTVPAEFMPEKYVHTKGALAAARMPDQVNPEKASSGSQFYIVQGRMVDDNQLAQLEQQVTQQLQAPQIIEFLARPENAAIKAKLQTLNKERKREEFAKFTEQMFELMKSEGIELVVFKYSEEQKSTYRTLGGTPHLDGGYTVFGRITEGFEVIDKIAQVPTQKGDVPIDNVSMNIRIIE